MNTNTLTVLLLFFLFACNNKAAREKSEMERKVKTSFDDRVIGIGKIIPENDIIQLSAPVNGIVHKIIVNENDPVDVGTVILELDHQLEDQKIKQIGNQIATQESQMKVDMAGVGEFVAKIGNAKTTLHRLQNLLLKGAESQQTVDDAITDLQTLTANIYKLDATMEVSKRRYQEVKADLKTAQLEREQKIIRSPVKGRVLEMTVLIGSSVSIQQSFAQISTEGNTIAICEIDEMNAGKIVVGQHGWIRSVGSADTLGTGTIYFASSFLKRKTLFTDQSGEKEDRRVRTVKLLLNNPENLLLNARVECVIDISKIIKN
ncbi:MAG: biotin/lipoyl-binding protein [Chitinophagaceae bacterium]|nr:biotin/lipoyl-binding protein [Chitinophagaceae bacterium]